MSEMVERVAKTLYDSLLTKAGPGRTPMPWDSAPERKWAFAAARAAILEMREPTLDMLTMGGQDNGRYEWPCPDEAWKLMIDEALN